MSRTIYKYTVEVLKKVSFNPKLFKRELEKASKKLLPHEYIELMIWAKNFKFQVGILRLELMGTSWVPPGGRGCLLVLGGSRVPSGHLLGASH